MTELRRSDSRLRTRFDAATLGSERPTSLSETPKLRCCFCLLKMHRSIFAVVVVIVVAPFSPREMKMVLRNTTQGRGRRRSSSLVGSGGGGGW